MSAQYREGQKLVNQYKNAQSNTSQDKCPGKCTCDFGTRSNYDQKQFGYYVKGENEDIKLIQVIPGWK